MHALGIIHERIRIGQDGRLDAVLSYCSDAAPTIATLLCAPHPNFAGDMQNNVVVALAERLAEQSVVLRFDYRGIGQSRIALPPGVALFDYWDAIEQTLDYRDPITDTAEAAVALWDISGALPMMVVGYSFGAITGTRVAVADRRFTVMVGVAAPFTRVPCDHLINCPKPCLMISGLDDFVYCPQVCHRLETAGGPMLRIDRLPAVDHFFRRQEAMLADRVATFMSRYA